MDFKKFESRLHLWQHLHFTAIELQYRDNKCEIYATATNHQTLSQLYLCSVSDKSAADQQLQQYRTWLHKVNLGRTKRVLAKPARSISVNVPGNP